MALDPVSIIIRFGEILTAPAQNFEMLWLLVPVYLNGIVSDYYQEKKSTSLGNAISNGFVALWAGLDWGRQLTSKINLASITTLNIVQIVLSILVLLYGVFIMFEGIKGKKITHYIGRIREVTYVIICLTPIFYGVVPLELETLIAILVFFPVWYIIFEIIMKLAPNPASIEEEEGEGGGLEGLGKEEELPGMGGEELPPMEGMPPEQSGGKLFPQQPQQGYPQQPQQGYPPQGGYPPY